MKNYNFKMSNNIKIPVFENFKDSAHLTKDKYEEAYKFALDNPEAFWEKEGKRINWINPYTKVKNVTWSNKDVNIKWFYDGTLNASYNCIDRHLLDKSDQIAIIWEGDDPNESKKITYKELHKKVSKFANMMKHFGVQKGDRVTIYMPMIPEAAYAMLACSRIGAIHSVVFLSLIHI